MSAGRLAAALAVHQSSTSILVDREPAQGRLLHALEAMPPREVRKIRHAVDRLVQAMEATDLELARQDSLARAEEEARARAAAERRAERRRADSLAALQRKAAEVNAELATIQFDNLTTNVVLR